MTCDLIGLANPGISSLQPYHPGKPIEELERELGIRNIIKLASNENPAGTSPRVLEALARIKDYARYPDGNGFILKQALARYHGVQPDQITLGNGSNDILELVARAFVSNRHQIIFSQHSFAVYPLVAQVIGAEAVVTPARNWGYDLDAVVAAVTDRTRLIFIANPNNPTGTWFGRAEFERLLSRLPDHVILVMDEAYYEYAAEAGVPNAVEWVAEHPNLVVARTFSKVYGLAGLRVGYAVSHRDAADLMNRVRQPFNVNSAALLAAETALQDSEHLQRCLELNRSGMQQLIAGFDRMGIGYIPSLTNFICIDLEQPALPVYQKLLREGVIVRPVDNYGMPDHLRITVGLPEENELFLAALARVLAA